MSALRLRTVDLDNHAEFRHLRLMYLHVQMTDVRVSDNWHYLFPFGQAEFYRQKLRAREMELAADNKVAFVETPQDGIIGFVAAKGKTKTFGDDTGGLDQIYIAPAQRGRGHGGAVLARVEEFFCVRGCRRAALITAQRNFPARHLYEAAGWHADRPAMAGYEFWLKDLRR